MFMILLRYYFKGKYYLFFAQQIEKIKLNYYQEPN